MELIERYLDLVKSSVSGGLDTTFPQDWQFSLLDENKRFWQAMTSNTLRTMLGHKKLANIRFCVEDIVKNQIPGDLLEAGCWRGGSVIYMAACMQAYRSYYQDKIERKIIAADLFPTEVDVSNKFFLNFILKIGSHIHKILPHRFKQWIASKL